MKNTGINKLHVLAILTLFLMSAATADVNIRDRTNIFGNLNANADTNLNGNDLTGVNKITCKDGDCDVNSDLSLWGQNIESADSIETDEIDGVSIIDVKQDLDMHDNNIENVGTVTMSTSNGLDMDGEGIKNVGNITGSGLEIDFSGDIDMNGNNIRSLNSITSDIDMSGHDITNIGTIEKSNNQFVQDINSTHEAAYTSQESPFPRAVFEEDDLVVRDGEASVELPNHFDKVSSSESPQIITHVTPDTPVAVGVVKESTKKIKIEADTDETFRADLTVKAVREGFEDSETVRKKQ
jgi:hypothetical protein